MNHYQEYLKYFNKLYPIQYEFSCRCNGGGTRFYYKSLRLSGILGIYCCLKCDSGLMYTGNYKIGNVIYNYN